ncbi:MAG: RHS repeat-associated core domain-containing protein [Luteolibacter sp.]
MLRATNFAVSLGFAARICANLTHGRIAVEKRVRAGANRGFLTGKRDDADKGADYTYTSAGRLATRTWARSSVASPLVTTYSYDAGMLVTTDYSDSTPDVTQSYDNFGRPTETSNDVSTTTYAYDPATLVLDTETISHDLDTDGTPELTRVIDRKQDGLLRPTGYILKDGATTEQDSTYTFGDDGRLASVGDGTDSFNYDYLPDSNLLETVTGPAHTLTNSYDNTRSVLLSKENKVGATLVSGYTYTVNALGQRMDVSQAGTAFAASRSIAWGYDALGQVTKADSSISGADRAYQYDMIGNRLKSADSLTLPGSPNYAVNALNQYTAVDSNNPAYDDDGNATAYPVPAHLAANSTLTWDAENRLTGATVNSVTTTYLYDAQSRRIATINGATTTLTIYDGWNPIAKYSGATLEETYIWGMDLSGSMQGAGGVGGLLAVNDGSASYYPTYDGNGNVSEYLDSSGTVQAHYEYDPFGRITVATEPKAQDFAHRFSTKPLDVETNFYYYGYRFYDPVTGRWPSRDPIGERGGVNLYGFAGNDGVGQWDFLGLEFGFDKNKKQNFGGPWIAPPNANPGAPQQWWPNWLPDDTEWSSLAIVDVTYEADLSCLTCCAIKGFDSPECEEAWEAAKGAFKNGGVINTKVSALETGTGNSPHAAQFKALEKAINKAKDEVPKCYKYSRDGAVKYDTEITSIPGVTV